MTVLNNDGLVGRVLRVTRDDRHRAADRRHRLGRRRPGRREHEGRLPARPRRPRRRTAASTSSWSTSADVPGQGRHRRDLGQPGRRAVRLRRAGRPGHRGLRQPARVLPARGDRARSSTSAPSTWSASWCPSGTAQRPGRHRGRREPASEPSVPRPRRRRRLVAWPLVLQVARLPAPRLARASCPTSACSSWSRAALVRGPQFAAVLGFFAGLLLDLAPPADHVAGRWALALVVVGYVAGRMRQDARARRADHGGRHRRRVVVRRHVGLRAHRPGARRPRRLGCRRPAPGDPGRPAAGTSLLTPFVLPLRDAAVRAGSSRAGRPDGAVDLRRERRRRATEPAAPGRGPGPGVLALRHAVRPALLPPGRQRRRLPRPGRRRSRCARSSSSRSAA